MRASSGGPLTDRSNISRKNARPRPPPSDANEPDHDDRGAVGAERLLGPNGGFAQAEALRLAIFLELHRALGLQLLGLDFAVACLSVAVVARELAVFAFDFGNLLESGVVGTLFRPEVVALCGELRQLTLRVL